VKPDVSGTFSGRGKLPLQQFQQRGLATSGFSAFNTDCIVATVLAHLDDF